MFFRFTTTQKPTSANTSSPNPNNNNQNNNNISSSTDGGSDENVSKLEFLGKFHHSTLKCNLTIDNLRALLKFAGEFNRTPSVGEVTGRSFLANSNNGLKTNLSAISSSHMSDSLPVSPSLNSSLNVSLMDLQSEIMDSNIFGTQQESYLETSILTKYPMLVHGAWWVIFDNINIFRALNLVSVFLHTEVFL